MDSYSQNVGLFYSMQLNSDLNFTRPWRFYLQTEAVLKGSVLLNTGGGGG